MNNLSFIAGENVALGLVGVQEENAKGVGGLEYGGTSQEMDNKNFKNK